MQLPGVQIQTDGGDTETDLQLGLLGTVVGLVASLLVLRRERRGGRPDGDDRRVAPSYREPIST